ncbi:MAG: UMP kinase [Candidatus Pacearchaeota archaeon]
MKNLWVISLGGSRIVPNDIDEKFIKNFKKLIDSHPHKKFIIVTGGGSTSRKYMKTIKNFGKNTKEQSQTGIAITRFHAKFMARIFGAKANSPDNIPMNMKQSKNLLRKNQIVFCGALRWEADKTSDGTAAELAKHLKCKLINLTNVDGLYTKNPKKFRSTKKIPRISWKKFYEITNKIKFHAGQNFVLDQDAAKTIMKNNIPTYIIGDLDDMDKILKEKKDFKGTLIEG